MKFGSLCGGENGEHNGTGFVEISRIFTIQDAGNVALISREIGVILCKIPAKMKKYPRYQRWVLKWK